MKSQQLSIFVHGENIFTPEIQRKLMEKMKTPPRRYDTIQLGYYTDIGLSPNGNLMTCTSIAKPNHRGCIFRVFNRMSVCCLKKKFNVFHFHPDDISINETIGCYYIHNNIHITDEHLRCHVILNTERPVSCDIKLHKNIILIREFSFMRPFTNRLLILTMKRGRQIKCPVVGYQFLKNGTYFIIAKQ